MKSFLLALYFLLSVPFLISSPSLTKWNFIEKFEEKFYESVINIILLNSPRLGDLGNFPDSLRECLGVVNSDSDYSLENMCAIALNLLKNEIQKVEMFESDAGKEIYQIMESYLEEFINPQTNNYDNIFDDINDLMENDPVLLATNLDWKILDNLVSDALVPIVSSFRFPDNDEKLIGKKRNLETDLESNSDFDLDLDLDLNSKLSTELWSIAISSLTEIPLQLFVFTQMFDVNLSQFFSSACDIEVILSKKFKGYLDLKESFSEEKVFQDFREEIDNCVISFYSNINLADSVEFFDSVIKEFKLTIFQIAESILSETNKLKESERAKRRRRSKEQTIQDEEFSYRCNDDDFVTEEDIIKNPSKYLEQNICDPNSIDRFRETYSGVIDREFGDLDRSSVNRLKTIIDNAIITQFLYLNT